jgi:hypothetical protein
MWVERREGRRVREGWNEGITAPERGRKKKKEMERV